MSSFPKENLKLFSFLLMRTMSLSWVTSPKCHGLRSLSLILKPKGERLDELFAVKGIPHLVILDDNGKVLTHGGVGIILEYGVEGYPFTPEWVKEIKDQEAAAKGDQSLKSYLTLTVTRLCNCR